MKQVAYPVTVEMANELRSLFEKAEAEGLWFFSPYQGLWFSPAELKSQQTNGRFNWGAVNWKLRDPKEGVAELERKVSDAQKELRDFKARL